MSNYVYSGASWACNNVPSGIILGNIDTKTGAIVSQSMLTISDKPSPFPGLLCPLRGANAPCIPIGSWKDYSSTVFGMGKQLLLSNSYILCKNGGKITINPQISSIIERPFCMDSIMLDKSNSLGNAKKTELTSQKQLLENYESQTVFKVSDDLVVKSDKQNHEQSFTSTSEDNRKNKWCCGRCPKEFKDNCDFCKASENYIADVLLNNNSDILRNNMLSISGYESVANKIRNTRIKLSDNREVDWLVPQHHHIISGNECLYRRKKGDNTILFPLLVKLANLFKYNVNSFLNGIILPGYNTQKLTNFNNSKKYELAYKVMEKEIGSINESFGFASKVYKFTGSQLHFGQHTYENDLIQLKSKFKYKYPILNFMKVYEKIVLKYLNILSEKVYKNRYEKTCFMRDYNKEKKFFEDYLNSISEKIRKNIKEFPRKGKLNLSFEEPAYVSLSAMAYDIGISVEELNSVLL